MTRFLLGRFGLDDIDLYRPHGPVNLVRLMRVPDWVDRPDLKFPPFFPGLPKQLERASASLPRSVPVMSSSTIPIGPSPVIDLLHQSASDPEVRWPSR